MRKNKDKQSLPRIKKLKELTERELDIVREILILYQAIMFIVKIIKISIVGIVIVILTGSDLLAALDNIISRFSFLLKAEN